MSDHTETPTIELRLMAPPSLVIGTRQRFKVDAIAALAANPTRLTLDFGECGYIDSPGLGVLLSIARAARTANIPIRVDNCNHDIVTLLDLTKMEELFESVSRPCRR